VFVKPGKPPKFPPHVKATNKISDFEWRDFVQQTWFMYPADVKRAGHPAPFPPKLPGRLIKMYTYGAAEGFAGETVLDPFVGSGTTCVITKQLGRRFVGIDIDSDYAQLAQQRVDDACVGDVPTLIVGYPKYAGKDELSRIAAERLGNAGKAAEAQHKAERYGVRATTGSGTADAA
jgi:modification methylase